MLRITLTESRFMHVGLVLSRYAQNSNAAEHLPLAGISSVNPSRRLIGPMRICGL